MFINTPIKLGCYFDSYITKFIYDNYTISSFTDFLSSLKDFANFTVLPEDDISNTKRMNPVLNLVNLNDSLVSALTSCLDSYNQTYLNNLSGSSFISVFTGVLTLTGEDFNNITSFDPISCIGDCNCYKY